MKKLVPCLKSKAVTLSIILKPIRRLSHLFPKKTAEKKMIRFPSVIFPLKIKESGKTIPEVTKQFMRKTRTSTRGFLNGCTEVPIRL